MQINRNRGQIYFVYIEVSLEEELISITLQCRGYQFNSSSGGTPHASLAIEPVPTQC